MLICLALLISCICTTDGLLISRQTKDLIRNHAKRYADFASQAHLLHDEVDVAYSNQGGEFHGTEDDEATEDFGRYKRDVILAEGTNLARRRRKTLTHETEGTFVINQVIPATPQYYDTKTAIDINCQKIMDRSFVFSIEETEKGREILMHQLDDKDLKQVLLLSKEAVDAVAVDVFNIKNDFFLFSTVNHDPRASSPETIDTGSVLYRINPIESALDKTQTIHLPFAKTTAIWSGSGEEADDHFLAIAPEKAVTETGFTYNVMVALYRWQGGYFDYVSQVPASNPQAIQHFELFSHDYLAVANYQDDTGSTNIQSEIFKYNYKENRFVSFQKIQTFGAKDIRHFTFQSPDGKRKEHFIAIANYCKKDESGVEHLWVQSSIMKFGETRFFPFKNFRTVGALQFLPVMHGDKFFLALADVTGIHIYQYNGWTFVETHFEGFPEKQKSPFSISMRQLNTNDNSYFTVATNSEGVKNGMYSVGFETRNDHRKLVTSVATWCENANKEMATKDLEDIENQVNSAPKVSDNKVTVKGAITFARGVQVEDLKSRALGLGRGRSLGGNEFKNLANNERKFRILNQAVDIIGGRLNKDVVWVNRDETITGPVLFQNVFYDSPSMKVDKLQVENIASRPVVDHFANLVFLNQPQSFKTLHVATASFKELTTEEINGHPLSEYARLNPTTNQIFTGDNQFLGKLLVTDAIQVQDTLAGVSFATPNFLLSEGNQTFQGSTMKLQGSLVKNLYTNSINNHDISTVFEDALPLSGGTIKAEKLFKNVEIQSANVKSLNNINIDNLYSNAMYIDGRFPQSFTGATYFENLEVQELAPGNNLINQLYDLSTDFINVHNGNYNLDSLTINRDTEIQELFVQSQLNNIKVNEGSRLDVLLKNSVEPQIVKGKTLQAVHFQDHVEANELVDSINLSEWSPILEIKLDHSVINGALNVKGSMDATHGVFVSEFFQLGGSDVLHVLTFSSPRNAEFLPGSCALEFESLEVKGNSEISGTVNSVQPKSWVINSPALEKIQTITGEKTFSTLHLSEHSGATALYGPPGVSSENIFNVFPNLLLDGVDQTITQPHMAFSGGFKVNRAQCPDAVLNGIPFEHLFFKKGDQTVHVKSVFRDSLVTTGATTVLGDISAELVNGKSISEALKDTLRTGKNVGPQTITGDYTFTELNVGSGQIDGSFASSDARSIFGNIILKNSAEQVVLDQSLLTFLNGVTTDFIDYTGFLNGIKHSDWGENWLLTRTPQTVTTKVEFGSVTTEDFEVPAVNNIDVVQLSTEILRIDQDEAIKEPIEFMEKVDALQGIDMPNNAVVNGIDLRRDVLLKSSPHMQTVTGEKTFLNGVTIKGDLFVENIAGFDLPNFVNLLSSADNSHESLTVNGDMTLVDEPEFGTSINGLEWENVLSEYWFKDKNVVLVNPVQFSSLKLQKGGQLRGAATLNGVDLEHLQQNYASKSKNQEWTGQVTLNRVDQINELKTNSLTLENGGLFNGVDVWKFYDSVLRYTGDQNVHGNLNADNLVMRRLDTSDDVTLNSVAPRDLMTLSGPNIVTASKRVLNIDADTVVLSRDTTIDGVNLGQWDDNAVKRDGSQRMVGPVEFSDLETVNVVVDGLVDGVKLDPQTILTTDLDQDIFGKVTIQKPNTLQGEAALTAPNGVSFLGTLNDINLKEELPKLVFNNDDDETPIIIKSEKVFNAPLVLNQVKTKALIQGQDVNAMIGRFSRAHEEVVSNSFNGRENYGKLITVATQLFKSSQKRPVFLDHYVVTQSIQIRASYVKVLRQVGYPAIVIGFKKSALITTEEWYSYKPSIDYYLQQIGNRVQMEGVVADIAELQHGKDHLFAFAVNSEGNSRPAQAALEVINSVNSFEINKSPDKLSKTFILKTVDSGTPNVRPAISQVIYGIDFKSLRSFEILRNEGTVSCLAATARTQEDDDDVGCLEILCVDSANGGGLNSVQKIIMDSPSLTTSMIVSNTTVLGVLTRSSGSRPEGLLEMWKESRSLSIQFSKQSCIPVFNAINLDSISTEDGRTFLAVASGALRGSEYQGSIFMYRYSVFTEQFKKMQTIEVNHPKDVKLQWLRPSNEIVAYVLSDSVTNNIQIYKYKGLGGWNLIHQFTSEEGKSIEVVDFTSDGVYRAQLLVTSPTQTIIYAAEFLGLNPVMEERIQQEIAETFSVLDTLEDKL